MRVHLAYGEQGLDVELPDDTVVLEPQRVPADALTPQQAKRIRAAFRDATTAW